jgi:succinyl-CoA synthetase beta subunit
LNEYDAKKYLAHFGIPVVQESLAVDVDAAVALAEQIGYPVVLKASGEKLAHKTEVGGVALNLRSANDVRREGERLFTIPGCESLLVQKMVGGSRELVVGMTRDPHFGPCVMFGVGGVLTEAIGDAVFRLAPLSYQESMGMFDDIQSRNILGAVRGEAPVDRGAIVQILVSLGRISEENLTVQAIDINPLKILPDGSPVAVDALIVLDAD